MRVLVELLRLACLTWLSPDAARTKQADFEAYRERVARLGYHSARSISTWMTGRVGSALASEAASMRTRNDFPMRRWPTSTLISGFPIQG